MTTASVGSGSKRELCFHHRAKRNEHRLEALAVAFEDAEHVNQRLDRRDVFVVWLFSNAIVARLLRTKCVTRKTRERRVRAYELARLPPRPIDDDERDRRCGWRGGDVERVRSRPEERGRSF